MKRQIAAIVTATAISLAACTTSARSNPTDPGSETMGTSSTTSAVPPTLSTTDEGVRASPTPQTTMTSSTSGPTASIPQSTSQTIGTIGASAEWPVDISPSITGAELDAVNAAIEAWRQAVRVYDQSMQDPGKDWSPAIREYVADPAAVFQLDLIGALARDGMHQVGETRYAARVTKATAHNVQLAACVDVSHSDVVDADGRSITGDGPVKFEWSFNIDLYPGPPNRWLLNYIDKPKPSAPC